MIKFILSFLRILLISAICYSGNSFKSSYPGQTQGIKSFTVFISGEEGYHSYRIPSIAQAPDGTFIAIVEGRRDKRSDPGGGHIDLVYKLSHDGGQTWSPLLILEKSKEGWGASNPTVIIDNKTQRVMVFYDVWKPGRGQNQGNCRPGKPDSQVWFRFTEDNGKTWSNANDITRQARDYEKWPCTVLGPGHGIKTNSGRLVIPANAQYKSGDSLKLGSFALFSDDGGKSWERGQKLNVNTSESQIVELDDGRLMINARQKDESGKRWVAISNDGGKTWGKLQKGQVSPPIAASIIRYPLQDKNSLLLWSGPQGPKTRTNLMLRTSSDQGVSFPTEFLVSKGPAAYSDLTNIKNGDVGILWEGGHESAKFLMIQILIILFVIRIGKLQLKKMVRYFFLICME